MLRVGLQPPSQSATVQSTVSPASSSFRIPGRMILDALQLAQIGLVILCALLAKVLYVGVFLNLQQEFGAYIVSSLTVSIIMHCLMRAHGLHEPAAILAWREHLGDTLKAIGFSFLVVIAFAYLLKVSSDFSRGWLLTWVALVVVALPAGRMASAGLLRWLAAAGCTTRRVAVVVYDADGRRLAETLRQLPGVSVVGVFEASGKGQEAKLIPGVDDLISIGQRDQFDEVVVAASKILHPDTAQMIERLGVLPVEIWLCPPELNTPILGISRLGSLSLLQVKPKPIRNWDYVMKLGLDYTLGVISLVLFLPIMLIVAVAIKIDSRGPVFFTQYRHGYNHRLIRVYKFRTMRVAEDGPVVVQASRDDDRVTRVGRILRKISLDELPQLFNVLKGEMSLVGPRPHAVAHNQEYRERLERYANRHCVKPGMTGWAQIHGFRGPTDTPEKMRRRVEMDLYYIENWTIWLDLKIIALTPFLGFVNRNAF
jgi:putative colanic acid biosynthesis UDP-glucose lipid carrier transferase